MDEREHGAASEWANEELPADVGAPEPAESAPPTRWHVSAAGRVYGPAGVGELHQWAAQGRLPSGWQACAEGGDTWFSPGAVPELASLTTVEPPPPLVGGPLATYVDDDPQPDYGSVLTDGWELFKNNMGWSIGLYVAYIALVLGVATLPALVFLIKPWNSWPTAPFDSRILVVVACAILHLGVLYPIHLGVTACYIDAARTGTGSWRRLWSGFGQWSSYGVLMLMWILVCFIPGASYASMLLMPALMGIIWALADQQRGIFHACENLTKLLKKRYWWTLLTMLIAGLISMLGMLALGIGMIVSAPVSMLMYSVIYVHLADRMGWSEATREVPTGGRLALESLPMAGLTLLLLIADVVVYLVVF